MKSPAFQLYAADFYMDTVSWSATEVGAYFRLLMHEWVNGPLPNDLDRLARIAGMDGGNFRKSWVPSLSSKFAQCSDGSWVNNRLETTRIKQQEYREKQKIYGKKGAKIKKEIHQGSLEGSLEGSPKEPLRVDQALQSSVSKEPPLAPPKKPKREKKLVAIMPEGYSLTDQHIEYARSKGFNNGKIEVLFEAFITHHKAAGSRFADWYAAWQKWVQNEIKFNEGKPQPKPQSTSVINQGWVKK